MGFESQAHATASATDKEGAATVFSRRDCKDLYVWREAVALVVEVEAWAVRPSAHRVATRSGQRGEGAAPSCEPLGTLARRAAVAAAARIAEGHGTRREHLFACHLRAARGHLAELQTLLAVAEQLGDLSPDGLAALEDMLARLIGPLGRLIETIETSEMSETVVRPAVRPTTPASL